MEAAVDMLECCCVADLPPPDTEEQIWPELAGSGRWEQPHETSGLGQLPGPGSDQAGHPRTEVRQGAEADGAGRSWKAGSLFGCSG